MPKPPRLSRSAAKIIDDRVDDIFERLMARLLGHAFTGRRLYVIGGTHEDFSLPGIFREAVTGEGGKPDFDILSGVAEIARDYLLKHKQEAKARTKHEVNALLQDLHAGKISREEFGNYTESALFKLWDSVRSNVERVVETSNENAKTSGIRDGLIQINDKLGVEDPVVCFIPVHDDKLCDECRTIHTVDGYTPRVWLSSEVETGYHKKGTQRPSWNLIHPHCRCALTTILPGFGFDASGNVTWIGEGHSELEYQRSYKRPPKGEEPRLKRIGKSEEVVGEPIHQVKFGSMHLHMAHDKLYGPLQDWIHSPSEASKNTLLHTWTGLSEKEKAANAADVRDAFLRAHGKDTILAYRYKPRHDTGGMSLTSERPTYLSPEKYETYEVNAKDVIAHWGQLGLPLGGKAFGHEKEMILAPGAQIRPLGKSGGAAQEAILQVLQKASKPVLEPLEKAIPARTTQEFTRDVLVPFGWSEPQKGETGHFGSTHRASKLNWKGYSESDVASGLDRQRQHYFLSQLGLTAFEAGGRHHFGYRPGTAFEAGYKAIGAPSIEDVKRQVVTTQSLRQRLGANAKPLMVPGQDPATANWMPIDTIQHGASEDEMATPNFAHRVSQTKPDVLPVVDIGGTPVTENDELLHWARKQGYTHLPVVVKSDR